MKKRLNASNFFIAFLIVLNVLPILAPIFQHWGWILPAKAIYFVYSFMCHQIHWRSIHIHDHQCAWCTRDMAIWGAVLFTAVALKVFKIRGLKWYEALPFVVPVALDGGIQTIATSLGFAGAAPIYVSTNLMRAITGAIFGIGFGGFVMQSVLELENFKQKQTAKRYLLIIGLFGVSMTYYLGLVQVWGITSSTYKPSNFVDSEIRMPLNPSLWMERRKTAICPSNITQEGNKDILEIDCFWNN